MTQERGAAHSRVQLGFSGSRVARVSIEWKYVAVFHEHLLGRRRLGELPDGKDEGGTSGTFTEFDP